MVGGFCKPSIKALPNRILLVAVPAKHLLVAQRPRDVQVPTGALLGCVRGFDVLQFLDAGHEGFHGLLSPTGRMAASVSPGHQREMYHEGRDKANLRTMRKM